MDPFLVLKYIVRVMIIFLILPIHEYAHAWAAKKLGDDTALYSGRLTLNPLAHIDILGAVCLFFTGFGWAKPVPVNPIRFKKPRKGMALTALAGPASNLIVAFIAMIIYRFVLYSDISDKMGIQNASFVFFMISAFISINIGLAVFNLLPIPPLDGSKILSYFTSAKFDKFLFQYQQYLPIIFIVLIVSGILSGPINWISSIIYDGMILLTNWIDLIMKAVNK
ncbi:MAG: site-2 protease family protein [Clostridiales bacterium]|nr:site-2 protease family protein [Clostridiales bacterium]